MKAKMALIIGFLVALPLMGAAPIVNAQEVPVDNQASIDELQNQLINLLMQQVAMLEEQIKEAQAELDAQLAASSTPPVDGEVGEATSTEAIAPEATTTEATSTVPTHIEGKNGTVINRA